MKILLIGQQGQLAFELRRSLACLGEVVALDRRSAPLAIDLSDSKTLSRAVAEVKPDMIVNAAAYTAVDLAEEEEEEARAFQVNGAAPGILAEAARDIGAVLIHFSTDYVFPGDGNQAYVESDPVGPASVYGRSKLQGEIAIRQTGCTHLIFRTAWVYGVRGQNFLLTMLRLMEERERLQVVYDQRGSPTWSRMLAECTALILGRHPRAQHLRELSGIYHMSCAGETSWHGFATAIRAKAIARGLLTERCANLEAIDSSGFPRPAKRPAFSVLSNAKLETTFGVKLPSWESALDLCLEDLPRT